MKKYLLIICALFLSVGIYAQQGTSVSDASVQKVVDKFTEKYNLDDEQKEKMAKIQERRLNNLAEVAHLETQDPAKHLQKREAINAGTEVSIKMMLNKDQRADYDKDRIDIRLKKAEKTKELKAKGMSIEQMKSYLIEIEDEQY